MTDKTNITTINTESRTWSLDWHVYIFIHWPIIKDTRNGNAHLDYEYFANKADRETIAIVNKEKVAYRHSIGMLTFDLGPY